MLCYPLTLPGKTHVSPQTEAVHSDGRCDRGKGISAPVLREAPWRDPHDFAQLR